MRKFKIGDIVKGNKLSDEMYRYTNSSCVAKVISIYDDEEIKVELLDKSDDCPSLVFRVSELCFDLFEAEGAWCYEI